LGKIEKMDIKAHIEKVKNLVPGKMSAQEQAFVLSLLELVLQELEEQKQLIQTLKDEINRLKGEQGKPRLKGKNQKEEPETSPAPEDEDTATDKRDVSSEKERKNKKSERKKRQVKFDESRRIDERETVDVAQKSDLPDDAEFKGYAISHYQTLEIKAKNIELRRCIYYSATTGQTYTAPFPGNYQAGYDYTQELKGHIIMLKFEFGMSTPKIGDFLRANGVDISNGTISNILLGSGGAFKGEQEAIHQNGLEVGLYAQTDTTGARVNGENHHTHVFGNDYYTAYFTTPHKDRQTVLDLLRAGQPRAYLLNERAFVIYQYLKIPIYIQSSLRAIRFETALLQEDFVALVQSVLSEEDFKRHGEKVLEGAYITAYQADNPLFILVSDDAPQYKLVALFVFLCWVHIGRHFKKLNPKIKHHRQLLEGFLKDFWLFYERLKDYQQRPDPLVGRELSKAFDQLFSRTTGYEALDEQIKKTKAKKEQLLGVLKHPYVPLHNNASELAVRKEVRYRDVSFQTRNAKGTQAKDVFFTIIQTCKKLGVNAYAYILDRMTKKQNITRLDELILQKADLA